jgi:hypothetical protein
MGFDMVPHQFTFLFQSQAFLLTFFSRDPNILCPFHGLSDFVSQTTKSYQGMAKTSLYRVHVATSLHFNSSSFLLLLLIYFAQQRNLSNEFHLFLSSKLAM